MTTCTHCHQPIIEKPLDRVMRNLRAENLKRAMEAARRSLTETISEPPRWAGEGYDE